MSDKPPESPTTVKPLDIDDDDDSVQETGIIMDDGTTKPTTTNTTTTGAPPAPSVADAPDVDAPPKPSTTASSGETPPPKPPRPATEQQKNEAILKEAFPSIDASVIKAVLIASRGQIDPAFNALLGMSDPDAIQHDAIEQPPPQPPRPQNGQSQLDADEAYARRLAQHYEDQSAAYEARTANRGQPGHPGQRQQTGLKPNELYDDHSFLDDDLPVIQEQLKKGFQETQVKVNGWFNNLKKKFDEQFDEGEPSSPPQGGRGQGHYSRGSGDSSRRSRDYERYDADPELLSDDFAGMRFHSDGTPARPQQTQNPNLFKPPPPSGSPKPSDGRKVAFKDGAEEIDIYSASPKNAPKDSSSAGTPTKTSKWQPLSSVEPDPIAENDPFSLGDSDDDKDAKEKPDKGGIKLDDSEERLRKAAAEAMADSLVEDKAKKEEAKP